MGEIPSITIPNASSTSSLKVDTHLIFKPSIIYVKLYTKTDYEFWQIITNEYMYRVYSSSNRVETNINDITKDSFTINYHTGSSNDGFISGMKIKWIAIE